MTHASEDDPREVIREQREKLQSFSSDFAPTLGSSDIFAYIDRWEKLTLSLISGRVSDKQLQSFKNVRLKQRFELAEELQIKQLMSGFKDVLEDWLS